MSTSSAPRSGAAICYTVSAPCGSGKSWATCKHIAERLIPGHKNCLYVTPTTKLLREIEGRLREWNFEPVVMTHETHPKGVVRAIVEKLSNTDEHAGHVILITHKAYFQIPYFHRRENWQIFIDEVPQVDHYRRLRLPRSRHLLTKYLQPDRDFSSAYLVRLVPIDKGKLKRYLESARDDCEDVVRDVLMDVLSPYKDLFITHDSWQRLSSATAGGGDVAVDLMSMLNEEAFKRATLLAAELEHSLLFGHLQNQGMIFHPNHEIKSHLRYEKYPAELGARLQVDFVLPDRGFSKSLRDRAAPSGRSIGQEMDDEIARALGDEPFLLVANNDYRGCLSDLRGCTRIPTISHGLNAYEAATTLVFHAALNRNPENLRMLKALGLTNEQVRRSTQYEVLHQSVMRTNLRAAGSDKPVRVIVPDRFCSDFLVHLFEGTNVRRLGEATYGRRVPLTGPQRKQRHKFKGMKQEIFKGQDVERNLMSAMRKRSAARRSAHPANASMLVLTLQENRFAKRSDEFRTGQDTALELVDLLKNWSSTVLASKEDGILFQLTEFDPSRDPEGYRRQANFKASYGLILDFDDGCLSPEDFEQIFWHERPDTARWSFCVCNSFSRSPEMPNKFRVIFPFIEPARSLDEFQTVHDGVVEILSGAGVHPKSAKLDPACRTGVQPFYTPCVNQQHQASAFFRAYGLESETEFARYGLRPSSIVWEQEEQPLFTRAEIASAVPIENTCADLERLAQTEKAKLRSMTDGRHRPFYVGALRLRKAGMSLEQIEQWCNEVAAGKRKMMDKIPGIMESLRKRERCTSIGTGSSQRTVRRLDLCSLAHAFIINSDRPRMAARPSPDPASTATRPASQVVRLGPALARMTSEGAP